jgi:uncharacterized protein YyaL (SSP411 family)
MATANRLISEKSPYLLQHARNPVSWYPWGDEAFAAALRERKPVFLSIGYSTCHWCHVMEAESFSDKEVAAALNRDFIAVKVDREERPDIDKVYMDACLAMTGSGGWPLTIIMTPEKKPFFAGTYFPKTARWGRPGLMEILGAVSDRWKNDSGGIARASEQVGVVLARPPALGSAVPLSDGTLRNGLDQLRRQFDRAHGGFGAAPKFPAPHTLMFLLRQWVAARDTDALAMVEKTLQAMALGGIDDHLGFGFHRYSVDAAWIVPHFEKMLYDQAMLAMAYTEAYQATRDERYRRTAREVFEYVMRDMTSPGGGFYSAEDADSEGEEGKYYVWSPEEVKGVLGGERGALICRFFGVTESGNFEGGRNVLRVAVPEAEFARREGMALPRFREILENSRGKLLAARGKRVRPRKDDKILADWNGLMIAALAKGAAAFDEPSYGEAAARAARFIMERLRRSDGTLLHRFRDGDAAIPAYLDDYAFLAWGLLELYEATFEPRSLRESLALTDQMLRLFWDDDGGGLYFSRRDDRDLTVRPKDADDGAYPSGNSVAAWNLARLGRMTARPELEKRAEECIRAFSGEVSGVPAGHAHFLIAVQFALVPTREIVIAGKEGGEDTRALLRALRRRFLPDAVVVLHPEGKTGKEIEKLVSYVKGQEAIEGKAAAYVCENYACALPVTNVGELEALLDERR